MSLLFQETNTTPSIDNDWHWGQLPPASPALQSWLHEPGSLTRRLRRHCAQFHVKVLADGVLRPLMPAQAEWLQAEQGYCREVLLCCDNLPWVYATSLYSPATQAALPALSGLGSKALGELMFEAPDLTRTPFELTGLTPTQYQQLAAHAGLAATEPATMPWARRSALSTGQASVLVTELFLPNSAPYQDLV
ncbi:chorismate--pyruvate lyase family protein [Oceanimonas sp. CAM02]|uniref:chorismate--pyruvate lyase family protein n=1 Tax=Oceanimonas sp. CAM02 TaxID=3080336 RepID=UPI00293585C4|nr:chorismate lyase [Oceanimonas sp. CAM02]MDV2858743.1 chorismate lyase [Oceanimonas sp. CAM02]